MEKKEYCPEVLALRDRVKAGNDKLTKAWHQILEIADKEEQFQQDERWFKARYKLCILCSELQAKGYGECLYMENGKKMKSCLNSPDNHWCWVCPLGTPYWEQELKDLPSAGAEGASVTNELEISDKPCPTCGGAKFWLRADGVKVCCRCHPEPGDKK